MTFRGIPRSPSHEVVLEIRHPVPEFLAYIAIHKRFYHPHLEMLSSLGGTRLGDREDYPTDDDAITDVLRLSGAGMTPKAALADVHFGGAKAIIITEKGTRGVAPDERMKSILASYAEYLNLLRGAFVTAEDMNFSEEYLTFLRLHTKWVAGAGKSVGGSGNPSPFTGLGVEVGIRRCLLQVFGTTDISHSRFSFAIQGP